jgi:pyruvate dehydrogenase E1 component alpha subunit
LLDTLSNQSEILRVIGRNGNSILPAMLKEDELIEIYRKMVLTRQLDAKILSIQRQGRVGPYVPCAGEEATMVASAFAMQRDDWLFSSYRELGAHLVRGLTIDYVLAQLFGNSNDLLKGRQMSNSWGSKDLNNVPTAAPIGAYLPVAVGLSLAAKIARKRFAVLTYFGDGATSSSDFHTAMNFAGVYKTPTVFICRNNGWAISLPVTKQTASKTLAIKAQAYGFEGICVDGNDALAVYLATRNALDKARRGGGPTFIEAITYRIGPHSTADDPSKYRGKDEMGKRTIQDPIDLMKKYLISNKLWSEKKDSELRKGYVEIISKSIERQEKATILHPEEIIFDDVFSFSPWFLTEERADLGKSIKH